MAPPTDACAHALDLPPVVPASRGCLGCEAEGLGWVHLRVCLTCGHVGCCDSSEGRHASAHAASTGHPVVQSGEPGERWRWCYEDGSFA